jgi:hypothetical protein
LSYAEGAQTVGIDAITARAAAETLLDASL